VAVCCGSAKAVLCVCVQDSVYVKFVSEAAAGQGFRALHGWTYDGTNSVAARGMSLCRYMHTFSLFWLTFKGPVFP